MNVESLLRPLELTLNTPALLFPALTLIMLAYTNRFLGISSLIRNLYKEYQKDPDENRLKQIQNLKHRVRLIRDMQVLGVMSLTSCVVCMGLIYLTYQTEAKLVFALSLLLLAGSLILSTYETIISTHALNLQLKNLESGKGAKNGNSE